MELPNAAEMAELAVKSNKIAYELELQALMEMKAWDILVTEIAKTAAKGGRKVQVSFGVAPKETCQYIPIRYRATVLHYLAEKGYAVGSIKAGHTTHEYELLF